MHVLISGGGIGGLTTALAFQKLGHHVTVLEQSHVLDEVGAGLQISPNGMRVFEALGVSARVERDAFRPKSQELRFGRGGGRILTIPLREASHARWGGEYLHVHRADLVEALGGALQDRQAGAVRLGHRVVSYSQDETQVAAHLDTGETISGDLLVGADGIHSALRAQMLGPDKPRYTGHVAWRAVVPVSELGADAPPESACVWVGSKRHAVTYRLRRGSLANLVAVVESREAHAESWTATGGREQALKDFKRWSPVIRSILEKATTLNRWALYDRMPLEKWSDGRVVLLGDACHPMLPFLAQGAVMTIEDAYVLARLVTKKETIGAALGAYEAIRKPRTSRVQEGARRNAALFHRGDPISQLATYGPIWLAGQLLPTFAHGQYDWIYAHDVTEMPDTAG
ncbi:MAG: FAD-dependent monooxygenase [Hyphomonas sp.]|nr:FAD-dependent monooxygenase [Hyphomonas sp.]